MSEEHFGLLVEKFLAQKLSPAEREELLSIMKQNSALREEFEGKMTQLSMLRRFYRKQPSRSARSEIVSLTESQSSQEMPPLRDRQNAPARWTKWVWVAVAALIVFAVLPQILRKDTISKPTDPALTAVDSPKAPGLDLSDILVESGKEVSLNAEENLGRKIITNERASAFIRFADGTQIDLYENTLVKLSPQEPQKGKEFETQAGTVLVSVAPQPKDRPLKIKVPHGTVSVIGTVFSITVGQKSSSVDLLKGAVNLTRSEDNAALQLKAGHRAVLAPGVVLAASPINYENGPLWTPADQPPLVWYDAADPSTIIHNNGSVSQWRDKSGNNHHASSNGESAPVTGSQSLNGLNALKFDGKRYLRNTENIGDQSYSYAIIGTKDANRDLNALISENGGQQNSVLHHPDGFSIKSSSHAFLLKAQRVRTFFVLGAFNGISSDIRHNGRLGAVGEAGPGDLSKGITIGDLANPGTTKYGYNGLIGEIIISRGVWSESDRQKIEGYLAHKWGQTDGLPANHPYKNMPPLRKTWLQK